MDGAVVKNRLLASERIAVVSDEISPDFGYAVEVGLSLGIRVYELRGLAGGRIPDCPPEQVESVMALSKSHNLTISGLSPGFFKKKVDDPATDEELTAGFDAVERILDGLGTRRVTVFSFLHGGEKELISQQVFDRLGQAAKRCRQSGIELLVENSASCWGDTGAHLAQILDAVGECVGATWDPCNAQSAGEAAFPDGYARIRPYVRHVHLKNWRTLIGLTPLLDGEIDFTAQIRALEADGYAGYYCLEPHQWEDGAEAVRLNQAQLIQIILGENE